MKIKIEASKSLQGGYYWQVRTHLGMTFYPNWEAANTYSKRFQLRFRKEMSAASMIRNIAVNLLTLKEEEFISKQLKCNCKGITKRQYGYLKGIYDRQQREW